MLMMVYYLFKLRWCETFNKKIQLFCVGIKNVCNLPKHQKVNERERERLELV